jgi:hypothetical protein
VYKLPTNNINYAYYFDVICALTFPGGEVQEELSEKIVRSASQLSRDEISLIGAIWRDEMLEYFSKQHSDSEVKLEYFDVEWCVTDKAGNPLGQKEY